jgi:hypothetical protein
MRGRRSSEAQRKRSVTAGAKPWLSPVIWISGILAIAAVCVIALSHVSSKSIELTARCERVLLPMPISLALTNVKDIQLWGYSGSIARIDQLSVTGGGTSAILSESPSELNLQPKTTDPDSPASYIGITPRPKYGPMTADLPVKSELAINPSADHRSQYDLKTIPHHRFLSKARSWKLKSTAQQRMLLKYPL